MTRTRHLGEHGPVSARRLTVVVCSRDHVRHHSLMVEILSRARRAGLAGATVLAGVVEPGRPEHCRREHVLSGGVPLSVVVVDEPERIDAFRRELDDLLGDLLFLVVAEVTVRRAGSLGGGATPGAGT